MLKQYIVERMAESPGLIHAWQLGQILRRETSGRPPAVVEEYGQIYRNQSLRREDLAEAGPSMERLALTVWLDHRDAMSLSALRRIVGPVAGPVDMAAYDESKKETDFTFSVLEEIVIIRAQLQDLVAAVRHNSQRYFRDRRAAGSREPPPRGLVTDGTVPGTLTLVRQHLETMAAVELRRGRSPERRDDIAAGIRWANNLAERLSAIQDVLNEM